jgi:hypothetical protein
VNSEGFVKSPSAALRFPPEAGKHARPVEFSLRETAKPIQQGKSLRRTSMYASFLNLPAAGRHSRALHLELFSVPSSLTTFYEFINSYRQGFQKGVKHVTYRSFDDRAQVD